MNPNDEVKSQWTNATGTKPIDGSNNDPTYGRLVTYRDGHVTLYVYKRGSGNPDQGIPDQQVGEPQQQPVDPDQEKIWKDQEKSAAQPPAHEPNPADPTRERVWDPKANGGAGGWTDGGPIAPKPATGTRQVQAVTYENRGGKSVKVTTYTDGTKSEEESAPPAQGATSTVDVGGVHYERQPDGTWTPAKGLPTDPSKAPAKYSQVKQDEASGKWFGLTPQGTWESIEGGPGSQGSGPPVPASATGWKPDFSKPDLGIFERRSEVQAQLTAGVFGDPTSKAAQDKANALLKQDLDFASTAATNVGNIASGEQTIYNGGISQRSQDVTQADTRTSAAASIYNNALSQMAQLAPFMKEHSKNAGAMFDDMLTKAYAFQQKMGGQFTPEHVQPGPYMSRTADIFKPGGSGAPGAVGAAAAAPGAAPAAPLAPTPFTFTPPPTGAPRTAPATQGPFAPPAPAAAPQGAPQAPTIAPSGASEPLGPRDNPTSPIPPTYVPPGQAPASTAPMDNGPWIPGPRPGDFPTTDPGPPTYYPGTPGTPPGGQDPSVTWQSSPAITALQGQPLVQGGVMDWAQQMGGWSPGALAAFAQMQGQQPAA